VNPVIAIQSLEKVYGGVAAVSDLSFEVAPGSVCGLLGPNGSGKTTTFKCMLGFTRPDAGTVLFDGKPLVPRDFERLVYVAERPALFDSMTVAQHLEMRRYSHRTYDPKRAAELVELFSIDTRKRARTISKGQKTAVQLILAFSVRPSILVLDEPASGLDPVHQRHVLDLIIEASSGGAAVLFSSHQITQVERAADRVAIIKNGKLVLCDDVDNLKSREKVVEAIFDGAVPELDGIVTGDRVRHVDRTTRSIRLFVRSDADAVVRDLERLGAKGVTVSDLNLEEIFLSAVEAR